MISRAVNKTKQVGRHLRTLYMHPRTDVYIVSFPKSGRTWLRVLIGKTLCETFSLPANIMLDTYKITTAARILKTQFTHDNSSINDGWDYRRLSSDKSWYAEKKVIFLYRDIKDVLVSCYFQATKRVNKYSDNISAFIRSEKYGAKKVVTFYNIWDKNRMVPREFLLLRYENLHKNPGEVLTQTMNFLGLTEVDDSVMDQAVEFASFRSMKSLEEGNFFKHKMLKPVSAGDSESYKVRKGVVGGYSSYLSEDDVRYIDQVIEELGCPFNGVGYDTLE